MSYYCKTNTKNLSKTYIFIPLLYKYSVILTYFNFYDTIYMCVEHYASQIHYQKMGLKIHQLYKKILYIFCFFRPDGGIYIILDLRKRCNGIYPYPFIKSSKMNVHVVSGLLGFFEKQTAKANKSSFHLFGKTSSVSLL